jgi:aspartate/methionine/tyrosine aminotransferase
VYESVISFLGGHVVPYQVDPVTGISVDELEQLVTSHTRFLVLNSPHNPTGTRCSHEQLAAIAAFAVKHDLLVLTDEAYERIVYDGFMESIVSFPGMEERTVILYTWSKTYAMTGLRIGAAVGPDWIIEAIVRLANNDESGTSHPTQYAALEALTGDQSGVAAMLKVLEQRRDSVVELLNGIPGISCVRPDSTFYVYPDVTALMSQMGCGDYETFRRRVLHESGFSFCTLEHFGRMLPREKCRHVRLAYSGIDLGQISEGLTGFRGYVEGLRS